jgi:SAM-dependent methyltransferase
VPVSGSEAGSADAYDAIGRGYGAVRRPDPRIRAQIRAAIGAAASVLNVGAGSGSYEPLDVLTVAVEPSEVMIAQRRPAAAPVVRGAAEALPFAHGRFDVALAVNTVHHWRDPAGGLAEMRRTSRRQVVLTWDPTFRAERFWFARDYLPQAVGRELALATVEDVIDALGPGARVDRVLLPADCTDGFYAAYWARPAAYLDPSVRAGISVLALADPPLVADAVRRLEADLRSGTWRERNAELLDRRWFDAGYRLVVAGGPAAERSS